MIIKNELQNLEKIKGLIFDIDGTITQWISVPEFLKEMLNEYDLLYSDEVLTQFFNALSQHELHVLTTGEVDSDIYGMYLENNISLLKENHISGIEFKNKMFTKEADNVKVEDHLPEEMKKLASSYSLYCYTNWFYKQAVMKLRKYDLEKYFHEIFAFENQYMKYSKMGFLSILSKLELESSEVIHIGDSKCDIDVSQKAGIQSILIDYELNKQDLYSSTSCIVSNFSDIRKVLKK